MSYWCHATNEVVIGEARSLVPTEIRKVIYIAQTKLDERSNYLQFSGQSEGWEIVKSVAVRRSSAEIYAQLHPPVIVGEKEVRFLLPRKAKERFSRRKDDDDVKPEIPSEITQ